MKNYDSRPISDMVVQKRRKRDEVNITMVEYSRLAAALKLLGLPRKRIYQLAKFYRDELAVTEAELKDLEGAVEDCGDSYAAQQELLIAMNQRHAGPSRHDVNGTPVNVRVREHLRLKRRRLDKIGRPELETYPDMTRAEALRILFDYVQDARNRIELYTAELAAGCDDKRAVRRCRDRLRNDLEYLGCT